MKLIMGKNSSWCTRVARKSPSLAQLRWAGKRVKATGTLNKLKVVTEICQ